MKSSSTFRFFRFGLLIAGILMLAYAGLYFLQDRIIFQASSLDRHHPFQFEDPFEEHFISVGDNDTLNALLFRGDSTPRGLILYFHGNRGNLQRWGRYASGLARYGYDVLVIDYRGYGKSTGRPTEAALYSDAREVYRWAKTNLHPAHIVLYGRSLGSAVASRLAAEVSPALLILETPFDELKGVATPYAEFLASIFPFKYSFSNSAHLRSVTSRVVIFHGTNDRIVPLQSALKLKEFIRSPQDFVIVNGGTHDNLATFREYQEKIKGLLSAPPF